MRAVALRFFTGLELMVARTNGCNPARCETRLATSTKTRTTFCAAAVGLKSDKACLQERQASFGNTSVSLRWL